MMKLTRVLEIAEPLQVPVAAAQQADPYLMTALAFALFGLVLVIHTRLQRRAAARRAAEAETAIQELTTLLGEVGKNTKIIDQRLQQLTRRVDQLQISRGGSNDLRQAAHLVRDGATTDQLVDLCGMSRGEAELFRRLHS